MSVFFNINVVQIHEGSIYYNLYFSAGKSVFYCRAIIITLSLKPCPNSNPKCVHSESWRLGSGLRAQGCGQEGVPQVPQALHLVRAGENSQQTHPILRLTGSKELCWCSCIFTCHAWISAEYKTVAKWQPSPFSSDEMADRPELHVRLWGSSGWLLLLRCDQTSPSCDFFPSPVLRYKPQWGRKCCYGAP